MSTGNAVALASVVKMMRSAAFDYSDLSSSVAAFLKGQAERIRRQASSSVINIGKDLVEAKRHLSHGAFMAWVEGEVGIPARTAQAYMRVAKWAPSKSAKVAHLPPSLLYLLAASSTPEAFAADILKRCEAGERISLQAIRDELRDIRQSMQDEWQSRARSTLPRALCETKNSEIATSIHMTKGATLLEAVAILARGLSTPDFKRVHDIMTDSSVIKDPELPQKIVDAFLHFRRSQKGNLVTYRVPSG
jgi:hypothetical protein